MSARVYTMRCTPAVARQMTHLLELAHERARARRRMRDQQLDRQQVLLASIDDAAVTTLHELTRALEAGDAA